MDPAGNAADTWSAYSGVWHLGEADDAVGAEISDSTANQLNGTNRLGTVQNLSGKIGAARLISTNNTKGGIDNHGIEIPYQSAMNLGSAFTWSGWILYRDGTVNGFDRIISHKNVNSQANGWEIFLREDNKKTMFCQRAANSTDIRPQIPDVQTAGWIFLSCVYDGGTLSTYTNGFLCMRGTGKTAVKDCTDSLAIGCNAAFGESSFKGTLDEFRLRGSASTADWIATEYASMNNTNFISVGQVEELIGDVVLFDGAPSVTLQGADFLFSVSLASGTGDVMGLCGSGIPFDQTNLLASAVTGPHVVSAVLNNLPSNQIFTCAALATNSAGSASMTMGTNVFMTGRVSVEVSSSASEQGFRSGAFTVRRPATATALPLTVAYTVSGTAEPGVEYVPLAGTVTIPAGADSAEIVVAPRLVTQITEDRTVTVTLTPGLWYATGTLSATMTIANWNPPADDLIYSSLSDLSTNFHFAVGQRVWLPALSASDNSYFIWNNSVIGLNEDGLSFTVKSYGATGIQALAADGTQLAAGFVIVPPPAVGTGHVWLWDDSNNNQSWNNTEIWTCLSDPSLTGTAYPNGVDDVAMLLYRTKSGRTISVNPADGVITLGELMVGTCGYLMGTSLTLQGPSDKTNALVFASTSDRCGITVTGGSIAITDVADGKNYYYLSRLAVSFSKDAWIDGGYIAAAEPSSSYHRNTFVFNGYSIEISEGATVELKNFNSWNDNYHSSTIQFSRSLRFLGAGTLWNRSALTCNWKPDLTDFTGTIRESGFGHDSYNRNANLFLETTNGLSNTTLEVAGFVNGIPSSSSVFGKDGVHSAGFVRAGYAGWGDLNAIGTFDNPGNRLNYREIRLNGGYLRLQATDVVSTNWPSPTMINQTPRLSIDSGLSLLNATENTSVTTPTNTFIATTMSHENHGMLAVAEPKLYNAVNENRKAWMKLGDWQNFAIGSVSETDDVYPVIPWALGIRPGGVGIFVTADAEGLVKWPGRTAVNLDSVPSADVNAYVLQNGVIALTEDRTVNSLMVNMRADVNGFGDGRTLTVTSGGVALYGGALLGGASKAGQCGSLRFVGDAYIWGQGSSGTNEIWSEITTTGSVAIAALESCPIMLGGDQTGIDGEIILNHGSLILGHTDLSRPRVTIKTGIRIVGAASELVIPSTEGINRKSPICFEDTAGYSGKINILQDAEPVCRYLEINGSTVSRGTYGAAGSGAEFIDDEHFTGPGILTVLSDTLIEPTVIIMY